MLLADELTALYLEAQDLELPCVDVIEDRLREELSIMAAENGSDREGCYCPERYFDDHIENFQKETLDKINV